MSWSEIKYAINSLLGTADFMPLNNYLRPNRKEFTSNGTFTVPKGIKYIWVSAAGGSGAVGQDILIKMELLTVVTVVPQ